jgi:RES domain-containing protein
MASTHPSTSMGEHPRSDEIKKAITRSLHLVTPWLGEVYRAANPKRANKANLLDGIGAQKTGGRWNRIGSPPTVYFSLQPEVAIKEMLAANRRAGLRDSVSLPCVLTAVAVNLQTVLDLRDARIKTLLNVRTNQMRSEDWRLRQDRGTESLTQAIGRLAREASIEALLVPSSPVANGTNLVVFRECVTHPEDALAIVNEDKLPPSP